MMTQDDIIVGCNLLVTSNKGISLKEQYLLQQVPKLNRKGHAKRLNNIELVSLAIKLIHQKLGRQNITPRDLKKAVINIIAL